MDLDVKPNCVPPSIHPGVHNSPGCTENVNTVVYLRQCSRHLLHPLRQLLSVKLYLIPPYIGIGGCKKEALHSVDNPIVLLYSLVLKVGGRKKEALHSVDNLIVSYCAVLFCSSWDRRSQNGGIAFCR